MNASKIKPTTSSSSKVFTFFLMLLNVMVVTVYAEGTKEMTPSSSVNNVELQINRSATGGFASTFAGWTATSQNDRLFIHIKDYTTEKIYVGFQKSSSNQTVYYRIKRPDGTVVAGPTLIPTSGNGFISSWSQANIGPTALTGNTGGYAPISLDLNASASTRYNGDYYIEFNASNTTANTTEIFLKYYDVTVASGTSNANVKKGRLWSYYWGFNSGGFTPPNICAGSFFVYSKDSIVTEVDLNGISPYYFRIFANSTGVGNTGNIVADRKSKDFGSNNPNDRPEFKVFLNDPDNDEYPSATGGDRAATFNAITGCPGNYCLNFTINGDALAELKLDLNNNGIYTDPVDRVLEANVSGGNNCVAWDGLNGLGGTVTSSANIKVELSTKVGTLHIPVYDAEQHTNGYLAAIVRPIGIGTMTVYWDDNNLSGGSTNLTGTPATAPVGGSTTVAGQHSWLDPAGNQRTMNTWFTTKKTVSNSFTVSFVADPNPNVSPITGSNSVCIGSTINLSTASSGGDWSSSNNAVATVNSSGVVTGIANGTVTISYTVTSTCGSTTVTKNLSTVTGGSLASISGVSSIQTNATTSFSDSTSGGTWSSANTLIATVDTNGLVTGKAPGTTTISYTINSGCLTGTVTKQITVTDLAPTAVNDTTFTMVNVPKNISPLANDQIGSYPFNNSSIEFLTGTAPNPETVGVFTTHANGTVTFTPVNNFTGVASIGYRIYDTGGQSTTAYIIVTISENCNTDSDEDGASDCIDEYPNDPHKAFNNNYPPDGYATLMFEDLWPSIADYDFNDVVVDYHANTITNSNNQVVEVIYTMIAKASGAILHNGFAFQLDGIAPNKISSVTGAKAIGASWLALGTNSTENGQDYANIIVFDDIYKVLTSNGNGDFVNTFMNASKMPFDTSMITVKFIDNGTVPSGGAIDLSSFPQSAFNPYIIAGDTNGQTQIRSKEIHLQNRVPSKKMNTDWFGTYEDNSIPNEGRYYKTKNNLPWGLEISTSIPHMQEKQDISTGYLRFLDWARSNGSSNTNWYLDANGNRDNTKIYTK